MYKQLMLLDGPRISGVHLLACKEEGCFVTRVKKALEMWLPGSVSQQISHVRCDDSIRVNCRPIDATKPRVIQTMKLCIEAESGLLLHADYNEGCVKIRRKCDHGDCDKYHHRQEIVLDSNAFVDLCKSINKMLLIDLPVTSLATDYSRLVYDIKWFLTRRKGSFSIDENWSLYSGTDFGQVSFVSDRILLKFKGQNVFSFRSNREASDFLVLIYRTPPFEAEDEPDDLSLWQRDVDKNPRVAPFREFCWNHDNLKAMDAGTSAKTDGFAVDIDMDWHVELKTLHEEEDSIRFVNMRHINESLCVGLREDDSITLECSLSDYDDENFTVPNTRDKNNTILIRDKRLRELWRADGNADGNDICMDTYYVHHSRMYGLHDLMCGLLYSRSRIGGMNRRGSLIGSYQTIIDVLNNETAGRISFGLNDDHIHLDMGGGPGFSVSMRNDDIHSHVNTFHIGNEKEFIVFVVLMKLVLLKMYDFRNSRNY